MSDWRLAVAIVVAGTVAMFADWFFGGVLFHSKYMAHPEIWRYIGKRPEETRAIAWSVVLGYVTCAAFVFVCRIFKVHGFSQSLELAALIWLIAPLPLLITNALFIKMHPLTVVAHSLGWLTKLLIAGAAVGWLVA